MRAPSPPWPRPWPHSPRWAPPSKPYLHLALDPGPNGIGLSCELSPEPLVQLLPGELFLQRLVTAGHQLSDLGRRGLVPGAALGARRWL